MVKQAFLDAVEWCKAHPDLAWRIALFVFGVTVGAWIF